VHVVDLEVDLKLKVTEQDGGIIITEGLESCLLEKGAFAQWDLDKEFSNESLDF
jgi:hypothetical protein